MAGKMMRRSRGASCSLKVSESRSSVWQENCSRFYPRQVLLTVFSCLLCLCGESGGAVGDHVHAVYPGDGKLYPARIAEVIPSGYVRTKSPHCLLAKAVVSLRCFLPLPGCRGVVSELHADSMCASSVAGDRLGRWHN
jgi:hypothetical protein